MIYNNLKLSIQREDYFQKSHSRCCDYLVYRNCYNDCMKLIDSHCHLDFDPLSKELEGVLDRAQKAGVEKMINIFF